MRVWSQQRGGGGGSEKRLGGGFGRLLAKESKMRASTDEWGRVLSLLLVVVYVRRSVLDVRFPRQVRN